MNKPSEIRKLYVLVQNLDQQLRQQCREEGLSYTSALRLADKWAAGRSEAVDLARQRNQKQSALEALQTGHAAESQIALQENSAEVTANGDTAEPKAVTFMQRIKKRLDATEDEASIETLDEGAQRLSDDLGKIVDAWLDNHDETCEWADCQLLESERDRIRGDLSKFIARMLKRSAGRLELEEVQDHIREAVAEETTNLIARCLEERTDTE